MHLRRSLATTAAAVLLTSPLLSSCGFNLSTDRPYTPAAGAVDRSGSVDILSAVVVAAQPDAGTFIATLSNNDDREEATLESVSGAGGNAVVPGDFEPVTIAPRGFVNLAVAGGVKLTGSFGAGDVLPLTVTFGNGETVEIDAPVVRACQEYAGLDPAEGASASQSGPATASPSGPYSGAASDTVNDSLSPSEQAQEESEGSTPAPGEDEETVTPSSTPTASGSASPGEEESAEATDAYSCDFPRVGSTADSGEGE